MVNAPHDEMLYQPGAKPLANIPSLDKIDPLLGYILGNVQVISALANSIKINITIPMLEKLLTYTRGNDNDETTKQTDEYPSGQEDIQQRTNAPDKVDSGYRANHQRDRVDSNATASTTRPRRTGATKRRGTR